MTGSAKRLVLSSFAAAGVIMSAVQVEAQSVEAFYKGKTVSVVTSTGAGGPYDIVARSVVRYMPKHLPGAPTMIVKNMPGAGHVLATNYMYNLADKDGTYMATIYNGIPMFQVLDGKGVRFDARNFNWLGSTGTSNLVTMVWSTSPVRTAEDLLKTEVIAGSTGAGSGTLLYPTVMNRVLGTKFKIVSGYKDSPELDLAMQRGEVQSRSGGSYAGFINEHTDWVRDKKVVFLVQVGGTREKDLADVPLMHELAKTDEERQILKLLSSPVALGRPFLSTPGVPADRVAALRKAFDETMADPDFASEAKRLNLDYNPMKGEELAKIVNDTINLPPELIEKARAAVEGS
jgi:tripartite-type tricarboxylate transporter receptor subunit TctC